jgi:hypothetical protein
VPFARHVGVVPAVPQQCRHRNHIIGHVAHAEEVVIHSCEEHAAGRRAGGGGVVVREHGAAGRECVEIRCCDLRTVRPKIGIAEIVD